MAKKGTTKTVHILHNPGQLLEVDSRAVEISIAAEDQVQWVSNSSIWEVKFKGEPPFVDTETKVFGPTNPYSGPARPGSEGTYEYTVTIGGDTLDPEVSVKG